ncbi:MAG TPA: hypothetical protein VGF75_04055 [Candidatus Saccharimonadales bacterium]|jgi:hypothetical protein
MPNKKSPSPAAKPRPKKQTTKKVKKPAAAKTKVKALDTKVTKLPNVLVIAKTSWLIIWRNRKTFSIIVLVYGLVYLILVLGLSSPANGSSLKKSFDGVFHGHLSQFYSSVSVLTYLIGSTTSSSSPGGSAYQVFILIIASLAIIWSLRQFYLGAKIRARDSYYRGLYPMAQYILVLLFIVLELLPLVIGLALYSLLVGGGIAVTTLEKVLSIIPVIALVSLSFYLISSSTMALYIVTLPDMTPIKALRSAKGLVKGRRWSVFRKIIFLPLMLFIIAAILILPFILIAPAVSAWIFFVLTLVALVYVHSYLYSLYRGLINE